LLLKKQRNLFFPSYIKVIFIIIINREPYFGTNLSLSLSARLLNIKMLSCNVCWYWIKIIVETLRRSRRGSGDDDDDGNEMDEEDHTDTETATVLAT